MGLVLYGRLHVLDGDATLTLAFEAYSAHKTLVGLGVALGHSIKVGILTVLLHRCSRKKEHVVLHAGTKCNRNGHP